MSVNRFETIAIIIGGAFIIALLVVVLYVAHIERKAAAIRVAKCHPYSVLSSYELDGKQYVVCGNQESKLLEVENR